MLKCIGCKKQRKGLFILQNMQMQKAPKNTKLSVLLLTFLHILNISRIENSTDSRAFKETSAIYIL